MGVDLMIPEYVIMILSAKVSYRGVGQGVTTHAGHSHFGERLKVEREKVGGGMHHGLVKFGDNPNHVASNLKRPSTAPAQRGVGGGGHGGSGGARPGTSHGRASAHTVGFDPNVSPVKTSRGGGVGVGAGAAASPGGAARRRRGRLGEAQGLAPAILKSMPESMGGPQMVLSKVGLLCACLHATGPRPTSALLKPLLRVDRPRRLEHSYRHHRHHRHHRRHHHHRHHRHHHHHRPHTGSEHGRGETKRGAASALFTHDI